MCESSSDTMNHTVVQYSLKKTEVPNRAIFNRNSDPYSGSIFVKKLSYSVSVFVYTTLNLSTFNHALSLKKII